MKNLCAILLCVLVIIPGSKARFGIPGTTQTINGYDTELGVSPMCWKSDASSTVNEDEENPLFLLQGNTSGIVPFPNPLVRDFKIQGKVQLLQSCPTWNIISAQAPKEVRQNERLRTGNAYTYEVNLSLNLDSLQAAAFTADEGPIVAVQIIVCKLGAGFCSPFIHEEANARLASQGIYTLPDKGDSHGGSHTHSDYQFVALPPQDGPLYSAKVQVPMLVNTPGNYFAIASVQMYVSDFLGGPVSVRYDMANALLDEERLITYQGPPEILEVPSTVLNLSYVIVGIAAAIISFLLFETIKHRNHQVLRLTQSPFLIVFLIAALVLTCASVLFRPKSDFYCNASTPIILNAAQVMYAITMGRLWRINAVISPLLMQTLQHRQKQSWTSRIMNMVGSFSSLDLDSTRTQKPKNLRKQVTSRQLSIVVVIFTAPQVIIQILSLSLQPMTLIVEYNDDESTGSFICDAGVDTKASLRYWGYFTFAFLVLLLLILAQRARELPSLFNETKVILETSITSMVLLVLGLAIIVTTDDPETSPAVEYMVCVALSVFIALSSALRIMVPKLQMAWRNEKVVVSRLVSDHAKTVRQQSSMGSSGYNISGLDNEPPCTTGDSGKSSAYQSTANSNSQEVEDGLLHSLDEDLRDPHVGVNELLLEEEKPNETDHTEMEGTASSSSEFGTGLIVVPPGSLGRPKPRSEDSLRQRLNALPSKRRLSNRIVITTDEAPARRLVLKMVDLQRQLASINDRILMGMVVSEEEWATVRQLSSKLGTVFTEDVEFEWEESSRRKLMHAENAGGMISEVVGEKTSENEAHHSAVRFQFGPEEDLKTESVPKKEGGTEAGGDASDSV